MIPSNGTGNPVADIAQEPTAKADGFKEPVAEQAIPLHLFANKLRRLPAKSFSRPRIGTFIAEKIVTQSSVLAGLSMSYAFWI